MTDDEVDEVAIPSNQVICSDLGMSPNAKASQSESQSLLIRSFARTSPTEQTDMEMMVTSQSLLIRSFARTDRVDGILRRHTAVAIPSNQVICSDVPLLGPYQTIHLRRNPF